MTKWDIFTVIFQLFTNPYWTVLNLCVCRVNSPPFSFLFKTQYCQSLFFNGFMSRKMKWIQGSSPSVDGNVGSHVWNALPEPLLSKVELRREVIKHAIDAINAIDAISSDRKNTTNCVFLTIWTKKYVGILLQKIIFMKLLATNRLLLPQELWKVEMSWKPEKGWNCIMQYKTCKLYAKCQIMGLYTEKKIIFGVSGHIKVSV